MIFFEIDGFFFDTKEYVIDAIKIDKIENIFDIHYKIILFLRRDYYKSYYITKRDLTTEFTSMKRATDFVKSKIEEYNKLLNKNYNTEFNGENVINLFK